MDSAEIVRRNKACYNHFANLRPGINGTVANGINVDSLQIHLRLHYMPNPARKPLVRRDRDEYAEVDGKTTKYPASTVLIGNASHQASTMTDRKWPEEHADAIFITFFPPPKKAGEAEDIAHTIVLSLIHI